MIYEICEECGHDPVQCHAAFDRVRELEAELAEAREQRRVDSSGLENLAESGNYWGAKWEKEHNLVVETIARAEKAEAVSRPEECPWRETDLGCPCEIPGLDNDEVRDKAIVDAADALKKAEARVAELEKGSPFFSDLPGWAQEKIQSLVRSLDRMEREAREREAE